MKIDIWSDIACPWCYVGKRRLERALAGFRGPIEIQWHAFELDPSAPKARPESAAAHLAKKYGRSQAEAERMLAQMTETAKTEGLDFRFDQLRGGNTFDGHRLVHFAAEHGKQDAMKERLLRAYFSEGASMSDHDTLAKLAVEVGLDEAAVRAMLASDAGTEAVRADEALAREIGITGVPFFVIDGRYAISGAQPTEVFTKALSMAAPAAADAGVCGPDGCVV